MTLARIEAIAILFSRFVESRKPIMARAFYILLVLLLSQSALSQQKAKPDSAISTVTAKLDSLNKSQWQNKIDSVRSLGNLEKYKDSLKVIGWADSLKQKVSATFASKQNALQSEIDSLLVRNQPILPFQRKMDSLQNKQQALLNEVSANQTQLQQKLNARYKSWGNKLDSLGVKMPHTNLSLSSVTNKLNANTSTLPNVNPSALPNLNSKDFQTLNLSKDLTNVGGKLSVPGPDQLKQWNDQLKNVSGPLKDVNGKLGEATSALKDPGTAAEAAAKQLKDVNTLNKEMGNADKLIKDNEALKTAEAMKDPEKMKDEVTKKAIDHFAGKEQMLQQAMNQMAKYKKKIPSLESLDKLPKHLWIPRNGMKGKPFRERVRFGLNAGLKARRDTIGVDLFPNVSYKLTGRVELGGGFNYRVVWLDRSSSFQQKNPAWGFNMFGTFKTYKSVLMRLEADAFSTARFGGAGEPMKREWQWNWYLGAQTSYTISKNCKGNVQMLYNFQKRLTDSFPEQLVIRIGVQWTLNENQKKPD
jgi:hypothetical protein